MATPPTADQLVAALRAEGLTVIEYKSWRTHNRNSKGAWGPVNGVMLHYTVSEGEASSVDLCYRGYAALPGPLCQAVIAKSGRVYMVGNGRANHAGGGDPNVLQAVIDERYNTRPPKPQRGNSNGVDGNARFIGAECVNLGDGKDPWPDAQIDAMVRFSAAICRLKGWTAKSTIGHGEWSSDKTDPEGRLGDASPVAMPKMRAKIAERLAHPPSWSPGTPTTPPPTSGTPMSKPNRLVVRREENLTLVQDVPQSVYWTTEYQDDGNSHGEGGKTVGINQHYSAVVTARFTGLAEGENVEIYAVEEDASGSPTGQGMSSQVWGRHEGYHPVQENTAFNGIVSQRLTFQVVSRAAQPVTLEEIQAVIFSWPNA